MPLIEARSAHARRLWDEAYERFAQADAAGEVGEAADLEAMADSGFASGHHDESLAARERALAAYLAAGDRAGAAAAAIKMANIHVRRGEFPLVAGRLREAEESLADEPDGAAHGLVAWLQGMLAIVGPGDLDAAATLAERAIALGRDHDDPDVLNLGRAMKAEVLGKGGSVAEAGALIDEAMTAALGRSLSPWVSCHVLCRTMVVTQEVGDLRRAQQWSDAAHAASERDQTIPLLGDCLVHRAGLLNWQGAWDEAEREAQAGVEQLPRDLLHVSLACYELGEIAAHRGDLGEAESQLERTHELGFRLPQPALAELRVAQGRTKAATSMLRNALEEESLPAGRSLLLVAQAEVAAAEGDLDTAQAATEELAALDADNESESLHACARVAVGATALARGDAAAACEALRDGVRLWARLGVPYRAARARILLAHAYVARDDPDAAELELRAALRTFEQLGARPDLDAARAALRELAADLAVAESPARRVHRAFMFTDIVNSTPLVSALGDEAWSNLLAWHDRTLRTLFRTYFGNEVDHTGDGFFVVFDTAESAVRCAEDIQRKLDRHRRDNGFAPQVRIGVHVDEVSAVGGNYRGHGVHVAARIGAQAQGGEVLVSREALDAAGPSFSAGEARRIELKGVEKPMDLLPIAWA